MANTTNQWKAKVLASIMLIALIVTLVKAADQPVKYCVETDEQEKQMRTLMLEALDQAFKEHMMHLFDVWVKDQAEEPARADAGAQIGISAYVRSHRSAVNWKPQRC